jgi:hypothetical protein
MRSPRGFTPVASMSKIASGRSVISFNMAAHSSRLRVRAKFQVSKRRACGTVAFERYSSLKASGNFQRAYYG